MNFPINHNVNPKHILFDAHNLKEHQFNLENSNSSWLFIAGLGEKWKETYESALNFTEAKNIKIAFAPGTNQVQEGKDKIAKVLDKTEIVFVNKTEVLLILFFANLLAASAAMKDKKQILIPTILFLLAFFVVYLAQKVLKV